MDFILMDIFMAILYKAPAQPNGKILHAGAAGGNWANSPQPITGNNGHSFAKALEHVIGADANNKFISYNNHPPDVPKVRTKSNSKGVLMMDTSNTDAASWIVHTVPGFPKARTGYLFPPAEVQKGHLLICLTIKEDQIDTIAMTLRIATPLIYYNDIPDAQMNTRPNLRKLVSGESRLTPPLAVTQDTTTAAAQSLKVTIYSKGEKSRYEIHLQLQKCGRILQNAIMINGVNTVKSQTKEPAMAVCIDDATIFGHFNGIGQNMDFNFVGLFPQAILYKAPAQSNGKVLVEGAAANWAGSPVAVTADNGHSFAKALEHVIAVNANNKFISYNNLPPDVPKVKTKSNSKGVLMMDTTGTDAAAWIVHTVPGFPKARTGYLFPPAEIQKGHLLICLTIKEDQIDTIALTLRFATPLIYYNDIPDTEMNSRPNLKKLVSGESRILPPLAVTKDTTTAAAAGLKVTIYSKGEKSRYEIYRKILLKKLKSTVKVWTARDSKLKSDCRISGKNIRLVTSPISINGDQSTLENDVSQWLVTETGNKFCAVDKPYQKSQAMEPTMAVCIDDATISARFKEIAQNVENCS
ncbi:Plancitoxin-1 [Trichinella nelsoni]|uniref:Plancitoxin-1 n=1 Tax=Trichinella nelsoni TaxID=6336 RepID=A0A0V0RZ41_9BILA|nr:Plancitoxin-1 [Trichinella nelsoni]